MRIDKANPHASLKMTSDAGDPSPGRSAPGIAMTPCGEDVAGVVVDYFQKGIA